MKWWALGRQRMLRRTCEGHGQVDAVQRHPVDLGLPALPAPPRHGVAAQPPAVSHPGLPNRAARADATLAFHVLGSCMCILLGMPILHRLQAGPALHTSSTSWTCLSSSD